jgi:hypothetical protein
MQGRILQSSGLNDQKESVNLIAFHLLYTREMQNDMEVVLTL